MTGFDDFDDDETVIHGSARPRFDEFDDDDTFLAARPTRPAPPLAAPPAGPPAGPPTTPPAGPATSSTGSPMEPAPTVPGSVPSPAAGPAPTVPGSVPSPAAGPAPTGVRSIGALQEQAPLGPGWQPPDRPTSYQPDPYDGPTRSRFGRLRLAVVALVLAVVGSALAVGAWLLLSGPGGVVP